MRFGLALFGILVAAACPSWAGTPPSAVVTDPAPDAAFPAAMSAFVIPSHDGAMNTVMYLAAGEGPHPTLLLLHGFPGNEQNLDLAQAARRAGWNVLTLHYRGSWGSPGSFSFAHCAEDAAVALAFLKTRDAAAKYRVDGRRIAVAGHSMGGMMAARVAADDPTVLGAFLIDPADMAAIGRGFSDPKAKADFLEGEVRGDMPPLAGTSIDAIMAEVERADPSLDLVATAPRLAGRPLTIIGAQGGIAPFGEALGKAAEKLGAHSLHSESWPTDHSFSDRRIALAAALVDWLDMLAAGK